MPPSSAGVRKLPAEARDVLDLAVDGRDAVEFTVVPRGVVELAAVGGTEFPFHVLHLPVRFSGWICRAWGCPSPILSRPGTILLQKRVRLSMIFPSFSLRSETGVKNCMYVQPLAPKTPTGHVTDMSTDASKRDFRIAHYQYRPVNPALLKLALFLQVYMWGSPRLWGPQPSTTWMWALAHQAWNARRATPPLMPALALHPKITLNWGSPEMINAMSDRAFPHLHDANDRVALVEGDAQYTYGPSQCAD